MLSLFRSKSSQPSETPAPTPAVGVLASIAKADHPLWKADEPIYGTVPESTQVGAVRQIFRVIGQELAHTTASPAEARSAVKEAWAKRAAIKDPERALHAVVDTLSKADEGYSQSTRLLSAHFNQALSTLSREDKLAHLFGLGKVAFEKMIDSQLAKASAPSREPGTDQPFTLRLIQGRFAALFIRNLQGGGAHLRTKEGRTS